MQAARALCPDPNVIIQAAVQDDSSVDAWMVGSSASLIPITGVMLYVTVGHLGLACVFVGAECPADKPSQSEKPKVTALSGLG